MSSRFLQSLPQVLAIFAGALAALTILAAFFSKKRRLLLALAFFGNLFVGSLPGVLAAYLNAEFGRSGNFGSFGLGMPIFTAVLSTLLVETIYAFRKRRTSR